MSKGEVTREEMLEWLWDKQLDADDLQDGATFDMIVAIRRLIEQSGEPEVMTRVSGTPIKPKESK